MAKAAGGCTIESEKREGEQRKKYRVAGAKRETRVTRAHPRARPPKPNSHITHKGTACQVGRINKDLRPSQIALATKIANKCSGNLFISMQQKLKISMEVVQVVTILNSEFNVQWCVAVLAITYNWSLA